MRERRKDKEPCKLCGRNKIKRRICTCVVSFRDCIRWQGEWIIDPLRFGEIILRYDNQINADPIVPTKPKKRAMKNYRLDRQLRFLLKVSLGFKSSHWDRLPKNWVPNNLAKLSRKSSIDPIPEDVV